jgi:uncharacterized membrane protein
VAAALKLDVYGVEGLLGGFIIGQGILFFMLLYLVLNAFSGDKLVAFDFLRKDQIYLSLAVTGFLYTLGVWADKLIFWFNPQTSMVIISPLRASELYDLPIFLSYLSILPGMAAFLLRMETEFAEQYHMFYQTINEGGALNKILQIYENMKQSIRRCFFEIFKIQGITLIILLVLGDKLLNLVHISPNYRILLNIDLMAVSVQVLLLAVLNLLFYFDYRFDALCLCLLFALSNIFLTLLSQYLGPAFFGYGFAIAVVLTTLVGLFVLTKRVDKLMHRTFMMR